MSEISQSRSVIPAAMVRAATDERTLREWKSLHYEKLLGDMESLRSIRLNNRYRMLLSIDTTTQLNVVTVISIKDYHK